MKVEFDVLQRRVNSSKKLLLQIFVELVTQSLTLFCVTQFYDSMFQKANNAFRIFTAFESIFSIEKNSKVVIT